ncbi:MetQ/NlpA family ABC transporter substrate-binding protein [Paenibacillus lupini]|uniref:MetQ/NlpA family ABC transporter substrate-binding protein n=1 Tax=Paenibacillus lupini TaxID=1450204 RepID=UPI00142413DF|nr:MetQ/NlpA family ABC transporter substrate-binding protein [Paenibacillus lupini]NIK21058.1 D-methionine transport system substrate-binding protein [Paenibacillus lupini]
MKKFSFILLALAVVIALSACGAKKDENTNNNAAAGNNEVKEVTLKVGASPVPHAEILNFIKPALKEKGINLEVVEFNDYIQPNTQLHEKQLDANFYQHVPFLDDFNKEHGYDLVNVAGVHFEPMGAYSQKIKSIDELKDGAKVAIPNDATNGGRALQLLAANKLITLKDGVGVAATVHDITENPKKLKITEVEAATLPRVLGEVDLDLINSNFALEADLVPTEDALFIESSDSPYVNILVARPDNKDSEAIKALAAALQTPDVKKFIEDTYKGAILPAFE